MEGKGRKREKRVSGAGDFQFVGWRENTDRRLEVADDRSVHSGPWSLFPDSKVSGGQENVASLAEGLDGGTCLNCLNRVWR